MYDNNEIGEEVVEVVIVRDTCISVIQSLQLGKAKVSEVARFLNRTPILNWYVVQ
jgi:hypothetical protein